VLVLTAFGLLAHQRAGLWRNEFLLLVDSARHYPDGGTAWFVRAAVAVHKGRPEEAVEALRASADRGYHFMRPFNTDPLLSALHDRDDFEALIHDIARRQLAYAEERRLDTTPQQLRGIAGAYLYLGEYDRSIDAYERAIRQGGPLRPILLDELQHARDERVRARAGSEPR
jgi:tetratricopeptide (TPR) repeat protein